MPVPFKRDVIKFEFFFNTNNKIPEIRPRTPPPLPVEKNYSPDNFSGSAHACSIYKSVCCVGTYL